MATSWPTRWTMFRCPMRSPARSRARGRLRSRTRPASRCTDRSPFIHRRLGTLPSRPQVSVFKMPDPKQKSVQLQDLFFRALTRCFAFLVLAILLGIMVSLVHGSLPAIEKFGFGFLVSSEWNPVTERFGALVPIVGTLVTSFIALLIGVPVSFGIALFLTELSPAWLKRPLGTAIELLAAIPSIIYGMWGLFVFAPLFQAHVQPPLVSIFENIPVLRAPFEGPPLGIGLLTAGLILSIMVIPFITAVKIGRASCRERD